MRIDFQRSIDVAKPVLAVGALAALAAWPLIRNGPPTAVDGLNHFYRLVELAWHVQHGDFYPRWFSDINYGFGGPLFNYYAPLAYYVPLLMHLLGQTLPAAFLTSFLLARRAAAAGMYAWTAAHFRSSLAGLVASAVYVFSPYLYYNSLIRGALPEVWGLALAPWLFWSAHRLVTGGHRYGHVGLALLYAGLVITHSLAALLLTPVLLIYVASLLTGRGRLKREAWLRLGSGFVLAGGLAAFFLLPFALENQYVNLSRANLDYASFFVPFGDLFAWPVPFDPQLARNTFPLSLSLPALLLAGLGTLIAWKNRPEEAGWSVLALWAILIACGLCSTSLAAPLWNLVPLGRLVQFPWRMLGPASLALAWLAGFAARVVARTRLWLIAVTFLFFFSLTWTYTYPSEANLPTQAEPLDVIQYEIGRPVALGLTFQQEFLPIWAEQRPTPGGLVDHYRANPVPSRFGNAPAGVKFLKETDNLTSVELTYQAVNSAQLEADLTYFPGWTATIEGLSAPTSPTSPQGRVSVRVPAGSHILRLELAPTGPQLAGAGLSLLALLICSLPWPSRNAGTPATGAAGEAPAALSWGWLALFGGLLALRIVVLDRMESPFYRTQLDRVPGPPAQTVEFGGQLALIGVDLPGTRGQAADEPIRVALYWQALADLKVDYHISVQLLDGAGNRFGQSDQYPGFVPTSGWRAGQYVRDEHLWTALAGTPPGDYHLRVSVYAIEDGSAKTLDLRQGGAAAGVEYEIGSFSLSSGWLGHAGPLQILEASAAGREVSVGDALPFTLVWQTGGAPAPGLAAELTLTDTAGRKLYSTRFDPAGAAYPPQQWRPGQLIRFPHTAILPPDLPRGPAQAWLRFVDSAGQPMSNQFSLGQILILTPERSFVAPPMAQRLDYDFGGVIRLLGYNASSGSLALYWQALDKVPQRYTVFVHAFDAAGAFIGGQDSPPDRATTSWLPGEIITDVRPALAGKRLEIGLYDPLTGDRLGAPLSINP